MRDYIIPKYPKIFRWIPNLLDNGCNCSSNGNIASITKLLHGGYSDQIDMIRQALLHDGFCQGRIGVISNVNLLCRTCVQSLSKLLDADHLAVGSQLVKHCL